MKDWAGTHLVIVGAARQGLALAKYLSSKGVRITVTDQKDKEMMQELIQEYQDDNLNWVLGGHPLELLDTADVLSLSGGIPLTIPFVKEALKREIPLTNDSQVFMDTVACPVIGITGSAGKTTTTLLVGKMAQDAFGIDHSWVGGNIGNPLIAVVDLIRSEDIAVVELSSFQLDQMTTAPQVACVLNVTPNHLDRHGTMEEYTRAKARILNYQTSTDVAVLNREEPGSWKLKTQVQGQLISFGIEKPESGIVGTFLNGEMIAYWDGNSSRDLFSRKEIQLLGEHNLMNVLAASAIATAADFPQKSIKAGVKELTGMDHRLEYIRTHKGADWYNDSIATAPERSIAAINTFKAPLVLLAGGRDKDLPWNEFARKVLKRVRFLVLFGEAAELIEKAILNEGEDQLPFQTQKCTTLKEAVMKTAEIVQDGDVVLLSPGGTSFDEFVDFADRGDQFKKWVHELS